MAQEFASDNSQNGLLSRLKLSNHRGFFSFIFATLSIIFILITFAAVQQQQTTNTKADTNLCAKVNCSAIKIEGSTLKELRDQGTKCTSIPCCEGKEVEATVGLLQVKFVCENKPNASFYCKNLPTNVLCTGVGWNPYCEWDSSNSKCVDKGSVAPPVGGSGTCKNIGERCGSTAPCCSPNTCLSNGVGSEQTCQIASTTLRKLNVGERCRDGNIKYLDSSMKVASSQVSQCNSALICDPFAYAVCRTPSNPPIRGIGQSCAATPENSNSEYGCQNGLSCQTDSTSTTTPKARICNVTIPAGNCTKYDGKTCGSGGQCQTNTSCFAISTGASCTVGGKEGKYQSGLCPGGAETRCCVPNTTTNPPVVNPPTGCAVYTSATPCNADNACEWKNNVCVNKTPVSGSGNVTLDLKLAFQGIVTLPKTKTQLKIKVKLVDDANNVKVNNDTIFTADTSGIWSGQVTFADVNLSKKYYLLIKGPMHVQKKICAANAADPNPGYYSCQFGNINLVSGNNNFDFSQVKMLVGDLDQNAIVNSIDISTVLNALLLSADERQSSAVLDKADLNLDAIVSTQDWSLVLEALKIKYDEE